MSSSTFTPEETDVLWEPCSSSLSVRGASLLLSRCKEADWLTAEDNTRAAFNCSFPKMDERDLLWEMTAIEVECTVFV